MELFQLQKNEHFKAVKKKLNTQVFLTNQIKQRVILEKARSKIIDFLGKPSLQSGESWKDFFKSFQLEDWTSIFGDDQDASKLEKVKKLLGVGSVASNKSIHGIGYAELGESIFAVEVMKDQAAWVATCICVWFPCRNHHGWLR